jgi:parallel beta-helix repeat protein
MLTHIRHGTTLCLILLCALLAGCGAQAARQPAAPTAPSVAPSAAAREGPGVVAAAPCVRPVPAADAASAAPQANGAPAVSFDGESNTIILGAGAPVGLAALAQALDRPEALRELAPGEWLLGANLRIEAGAALRVAAPEVRWLKLRSDEEEFVAIRALGGDLLVEGACVSSWDEARGAADEQHEDGRSYILARDGAQMAIRRAEIRYLGYDADESFGLAWRLAGTGGELVDSAVSHNYYGMYSYEVADLAITGNEVHHNVLYGIDPHTGSLRLLIEGNNVHDNGKHGIILADECADGVVRGNTVYNNLHHGIVLYQGSDRTLVEGNRSYGNGDQGLNINQSADNLVRDNRIYANLGAGIGVGQGAAGNELTGNEVRDNGEDGVVLFSAADRTTLRANRIADNERYGLYIKTAGAVAAVDNTIAGNLVGVYLKGTSVWVDEAANTISDNADGAVLREGAQG